MQQVQPWGISHELLCPLILNTYLHTDLPHKPQKPKKNHKTTTQRLTENNLETLKAGNSKEKAEQNFCAWLFGLDLTR